jgi:hypothetical protein
MRDFELITLSLDTPAQAEKARLFLQNQGAGLVKRVQDSVNKEGRRTNHYLVNSGSNDELIAALDPEWPGPVPHTVLVAPGGQIVWRHNGIISLDDARRAIVDAMSRFYQPAR